MGLTIGIALLAPRTPNTDGRPVMALGMRQLCDAMIMRAKPEQIVVVDLIGRHRDEVGAKLFAEDSPDSLGKLV